MTKRLTFISALFLSTGAAPTLGQSVTRNAPPSTDSISTALDDVLLLYGLLPFKSRLSELGITSLADLGLLTVNSLLAVGVSREHADLVISVAKKRMDDLSTKLTPPRTTTMPLRQKPATDDSTATFLLSMLMKAHQRRGPLRRPQQWEASVRAKLRRIATLGDDASASVRTPIITYQCIASAPAASLRQTNVRASQLFTKQQCPAVQSTSPPTPSHPRAAAESAPPPPPRRLNRREASRVAASLAFRGFAVVDSFYGSVDHKLLVREVDGVFRRALAAAASTSNDVSPTTNIADRTDHRHHRTDLETSTTTATQPRGGERGRQVFTANGAEFTFDFQVQDAAAAAATAAVATAAATDQAGSTVDTTLATPLLLRHHSVIDELRSAIMGDKDGGGTDGGSSRGDSSTSDDDDTWTRSSSSVGCRGDVWAYQSNGVTDVMINRMGNGSRYPPHIDTALPGKDYPEPSSDSASPHQSHASHRSSSSPASRSSSSSTASSSFQVSVLYYISPPPHGGDLRVYVPGEGGNNHILAVDIAPAPDRLVLLMSANTVHEVLPISGGARRRVVLQAWMTDFERVW